MLRTVLIAILSISCAGAPKGQAPEPQRQVMAGAGDLAAPILLPAPRLKTATRPLPADIAQYRSIGDVTISPDGRWVVYALSVNRFDADAKPPTDLAADRAGGWTRERQLWIVSAEGGAPRQLTSGTEPSASPRWAPDGSALGFLRSRDGKPAIHVLPMAGGEARAVETGDLSLEDFAFSADGSGLLLLATAPEAAEDKQKRWRSGGAYKYDNAWRSASLHRLAWGGKPVRLPIADHVLGFAEAPDGAHIAIVSAPSSDPYLGFTKRSIQIASATGTILRSATEAPTVTGQMAWSPDSRYLAFERSRKTLSLLNELTVVDVKSGESTNATATLDLTLGGFAWRPDSKELLVHVLARTRSKLIRVSRDGRSRKELPPPNLVLEGFSADASGRRIATRASSSDQAHLVAALDSATGKIARLVDPNPDLASAWTLGETEVIRWKDSEGVEIEGVLTRSPHAEKGRPGPLLILPHGGPDSVSQESFSTWALYFAARGYSVLRPNYRGGFGYGYDFYAANRGRLGAIEQADIESGVDHLVAAGVADPERLYYGGWSWGGYITTWTITKTNRYRAAVVGAGVVDTVVQYVTSDINHGAAADWEFLGRPWRDPESFRRSNPALGLADIKTPTLIIHGDADDRVSFVNGQILYRALEDAGTPVTMLAYPGEPHGFREPAHVAHMLEAWALHYDSH